LVYYDDHANILTVCGHDGNAVSDQTLTTWVQDGNLIIPADPADDLFIGIGDFEPDTFLEISASGLTLDYLYLSSNDFLDGDILKIANNGRMGLGATSPEFALTLDADAAGAGSADGAIFSAGRMNSGADLIYTGAGTRFIWYPKKCAFRAGYVDGNQWDNGNIGQYSVAMGQNSSARGLGATGFSSGSATGNYSTAMGLDVISQGDHSTALGLRNVSVLSGATTMGVDSSASENNSVALGNTNASLAPGSVTLGLSNVTNGSYSVAVGNACTANGDATSVWGESNTAHNQHAVVMGKDAISSNTDNVAIGLGVTATGQQATVIGNYASAAGTGSFARGGTGANAQAFGSVVFGKYNILVGNTVSYVSGDPLFVIGNGADNLNRANIFSIVKSGNTTIGSGTDEGFMLRVHGGDASVDTGNQWLTNSDRRLKKDIFPLKDCLRRVSQMQAVRYHVLNETKDAPHHIGLIAQDLEKIYPELVITNKNGYRSISYGRLSAVLAESVKELHIQNTGLRNELRTLKQKLDQTIVELTGPEAKK
jgi:hypothetical protein